MNGDPRLRHPSLENALFLLGALTVLQGLLVLAGWYARSPRIVQLAPGFPPTMPLTAVGFLGLGSALCASVRGRRFPAILPASAIGLLHLVALAGYAAGYSFDLAGILRIPAQTMRVEPAAPNAALSFVLLSIAVIWMSRVKAFRGRSVLLGLVGSVVVALAFTSLFGYVIHLDTFAWGSATPMALHTALGLLVLGGSVLAVAWSEGRAGAGWAPSWVFLSVTVISAVFTVSLWEALKAEARGVPGSPVNALAWSVLVDGLLLSLLLGAAAFFAQRAATSMGKEVAERRQAEQELDQFFALSLEMLCISGSDGIFRRVNPAFERTLGYSSAELQTQPYINFVVSEDRERTIAATQRLAVGEPLAFFENRYRTRDGSIRWMQWVAAPIPGRPLFIASARDATEIKKAQEALQRAHDELEDRVRERTAAFERANEALVSSEAQIIQLNDQLQQRIADLTAANEELEAFTYSVSHDLRAPLRHVDGFSKILVEDFGDQLPANARPLLDRVREATQRMGRMIDELLQLSRMARREPEKRLTGLRSLVDEVIADLSAEADGREVEWRIGELPFADCDPALIRQVFVNLLSNALKFTRPRKRAVIEVGSLGQHGGKVLLVRDNGVGFSMKYADQLFGPFQRLHRQEDFEGTGVGLATVQRIVHKHGGRIWAEAALDQGASFYFTLAPAETAAAANGGSPADNLEASDVTR